jgi:hypothetical protein
VADSSECGDLPSGSSDTDLVKDKVNIDTRESPVPILVSSVYGQRNLIPLVHLSSFHSFKLSFFVTLRSVTLHWFQHCYVTRNRSRIRSQFNRKSV